MYSFSICDAGTPSIDQIQFGVTFEHHFPLISENMSSRGSQNSENIEKQLYTYAASHFHEKCDFSDRQSGLTSVPGSGQGPFSLSGLVSKSFDSNAFKVNFCIL